MLRAGAGRGQVSDFNGKTLSTLNSSVVEMDPDVPEAGVLRSWCPPPPPPPPPTPAPPSSLRPPPPSPRTSGRIAAEGRAHASKLQGRPTGALRGPSHWHPAAVAGCWYSADASCAKWQRSRLGSRAVTYCTDRGPPEYNSHAKRQTAEGVALPCSL